MVKIIYVLNNFLPQQVAGTEVYVYALANAMQQRGYEITIVIPNFGKKDDEIYMYNDLKIIKFAEDTKLIREVISGEIIPNGVANFVSIIKHIKPNIIHFHTIGGSNGVSLHHVRAAKKISLSIVLTFHLAGYTCKTNNLLFENKEPCNGFINELKCTKCVFTDKGIKGFKKKLLYPTSVAAYALNFNTRKWNNRIGTAVGYPFVIQKLKTDLHEMEALANKIIILTKWYKNVLELNGIISQKLQLISQGISPHLPAKKADKISSILRVVFVGRINESKGLHLLIKAINDLQTQKVLLDIFGPENDIDYANKLKVLASTNKNIKWLGQIQPSKIVNSLTNYHVLCLPSIICEMSPLVIQEAFAAGIPVLASNVYGNAEQIIDGKNGWLFNFNDSNDLKNKLKQLIDEPSLIENAKKQIAPVKSFEIVADEHEILYKEILAAI